MLPLRPPTEVAPHKPSAAPEVRPASVERLPVLPANDQGFASKMPFRFIRPRFAPGPQSKACLIL